jgi:hypothetical protein
MPIERLPRPEKLRPLLRAEGVAWSAQQVPAAANLRYL